MRPGGFSFTDFHFLISKSNGSLLSQYAFVFLSGIFPYVLPLRMEHEWNWILFFLSDMADDIPVDADQEKGAQA